MRGDRISGEEVVEVDGSGCIVEDCPPSMKKSEVKGEEVAELDPSSLAIVPFGNLVRVDKKESKEMVHSGLTSSQKKKQVKKDFQTIISAIIKIALWNIKGLNSLSKQKEVSYFVKSNRITLCAILETRVKENNYDVVKNIVFGKRLMVNNYLDCERGRI